MNARVDTRIRVRGSLEFLQCLWRTSHAMERRSRRMEKAIGVTAPQRLVLRFLGRFPGVTAGQLAQALHVDPGTLYTISTLLHYVKQRNAICLTPRRLEVASARRPDEMIIGACPLRRISARKRRCNKRTCR